jgi:hypothetical protein
MSRTGADEGARSLSQAILKETSPELAIKVAYDFGRKLRVDGTDDTHVDDLTAKYVDPDFFGLPLHLYVRAGFIAGVRCLALPWRRDIEHQAATADSLSIHGRTEGGREDAATK